MNETEELALETVATGGPKEVLTEQANNDPEIPESISVEPSPNSEEKKNPIVDVDPVNVEQPDEYTELGYEGDDNPLLNLGGTVHNYDEKSETFELVDDTADFTELEPYRNELLNGDIDSGTINLAFNFGMNPKQFMKFIQENAEEIPVFGEWIKAHRLQAKKREELQAQITLINENKNLSPDERQAKLQKLVEEQGVTYGDNLNLIYLTGRDDINEITEQVFQDPKITGMINDVRLYGTTRGEVDLNNPKMPDDEGINRIIAYIAEKYMPAFKSEKGGVDEMSHELMKQISDLTLLSDKKALKRILANKPGEIPPMPYILAMRDLYNMEAKRLDNMITMINSQGGDTAENVLRAREQFEIVANLQLKISGIKTNLGRGLASLKRATTFGPEDEVIQVKGRPDSFQFSKKEQTDDIAVDPSVRGQEDIQYILANNGGKEELIEFFTKWQALPEHSRYGFQKKFYQHAKEGTLPEFFEKANEIWVNFLLTSPLTHARNMFGNTLMLGKHALEKYAIGGINSTLDLVGIDTGGVKLDEAHASAGAMIMSFMEASRAMVAMMGKGEAPTQLSGNASKFDKPRPRQISAEGFGFDTANPNMPMIGHMIDGVGKAINLPTALLQGEDVFFKVLAQRYDITLQAQRSAKSKGLTGDDFLNYVAEFVTDPPDDALARAREKADYFTFQNELGSKGKAIQKVVQNVPGLRWFIPFFKTPFNIMKVTFQDGTPLALASKEIRQTIMHGTQEEREEIIMRMATGSIAIWQSMNFAQEKITLDDGTQVERFTPGILKSEWKDQDKRVLRNVDRASGKPEYSIAFVNDDGEVEYMPMRGIEPFSSWLMLGADLSKILNHPELFKGEDGDATDLFFASVMAMQNAMTNKTFATGFDTFFKVAFEPERYGKRWIEQLMLGFTPNVLKQAGKATDPVMRQTLSLFDQFKRGFPWLREGLNPYMDLHGTPLKEWNSGWNSFWNPLAMVKYDPKKITNLQKEWLLLGGGPTLPKPQFTVEGVSIDLRELEDGGDIFYEIQKAYAKDYNLMMERFLKSGSAKAKHYRRNKKRWIDSNGTDQEARDRALRIVQDFVNERREAVRISYMKNGKNNKFGFKLLEHWKQQDRQQKKLDRIYR